MTDEFDLRICMCAGHYMYVFGGYEEIIERFGQDVYRLNLLTFTWELLVSTYPLLKQINMRFFI